MVDIAMHNIIDFMLQSVIYYESRLKDITPEAMIEKKHHKHRKVR
ncbi:hypothetical protein MALU111345_03380 [Marinicrinis lubricantis]